MLHNCSAALPHTHCAAGARLPDGPRAPACRNPHACCCSGHGVAKSVKHISEHRQPVNMAVVGSRGDVRMMLPLARFHFNCLNRPQQLLRLLFMQPQQLRLACIIIAASHALCVTCSKQA